MNKLQVETVLLNRF